MFRPQAGVATGTTDHRAVRPQTQNNTVRVISERIVRISARLD
jgi:hypothetical protein